MAQTRILIVEDESVIALELQTILKELGYDVVAVVNTGKKAIEKAEKEHPDLILMDIRIKGGMDGVEAADTIRSRCEIPIVFLTAFLDEERLEKAKLTMPFGYLLKPVQKRDLKVTIEMALYTAEIDTQRRHAEAKYKIAFKTSPDAANINRLDGTYVDINDGFTQLTGYTAEDVIGKLSSETKIWAIPEDREKLVTGLQAHGAVSNLESTFRCKDGLLKVGLMSASIIHLNKEPHILSVTRDISERKRAEEEIRKQKDLLQLISDTSPIGITVLNDEGRITFANKAAEAIFALSMEEVTQRFYNDPQWQIVDVNGGPFPKEELPFRLVMEGKKPVYDIQHGIERPDGKRIILSINATPLIDETGKITGMVNSINDITAQKRYEQEIEKLLQEKETLLKEVHHRIKNNMIMIQSLLSLQAYSAKNPESATTLENARDRLHSMMILYDKLYRSADFTRMSVKDYLPALLDEIVSNFPQRGYLTLKKEVDDFVLDVSTLSTIGIIVNELFTNTMKHAFGEHQTGEINISVTRLGNIAKITVQDNGRGLPPDFDLETNAGFGLKLVSLLANQLNGELQIEQGQGSIFILTFDTTR